MDSRRRHLPRLAAEDLLIGERVCVEGGTKRVFDFVRRGEEPVFNLEVDADHCYRVGQQGILVHNASERCCAKKIEDALPPKLDGSDMAHIEKGCLIDLSMFINASGIRLRIDPDYASSNDTKGRTNRKRASLGRAPFLENDDGVQLHHHDQSFFSVLDEISAMFHKMVLDDTDFHQYADDPGYISWRGWVGVYNGKIITLGEVYDRIRVKHWKSRF